MRHQQLDGLQWTQKKKRRPGYPHFRKPMETFIYFRHSRKNGVKTIMGLACQICFLPFVLLTALMYSSASGIPSGISICRMAESAFVDIDVRQTSNIRLPNIHDMITSIHQYLYPFISIYYIPIGILKSPFLSPVAPLPAREASIAQSLWLLQ